MLAQAMIAKALKISGTADRLANMPNTMTVASACTGIGTFEFAFHAIVDAINDALPDHITDQPISEFVASQLVWRLIRKPAVVAINY